MTAIITTPDITVTAMADAILEACHGIDPPEAPMDLAQAAYEAALRVGSNFRKEYTVAWEGDLKKDGSGRHQVQMGKFDTQEDAELGLKHIPGLKEKHGVRVTWRWVSGWSG